MDLSAERVRELLVASPFALRQAVDELKGVLKEDTHHVCAMPADTPVSIAIARGIEDAFSELSKGAPKS
jgi:hypothetical protein